MAGEQCRRRLAHSRLHIVFMPYFSWVLGCAATCGISCIVLVFSQCCSLLTVHMLCCHATGLEIELTHGGAFGHADVAYQARRSEEERGSVPTMLRALVLARHPLIALQVKEHAASLHCWSRHPQISYLLPLVGARGCSSSKLQGRSICLRRCVRGCGSVGSKSLRSCVPRRV